MAIKYVGSGNAEFDAFTMEYAKKLDDGDKSALKFRELAAADDARTQADKLSLQVKDIEYADRRKAELNSIIQAKYGENDQAERDELGQIYEKYGVTGDALASARLEADRARRRAEHLATASRVKYAEDFDAKSAFDRGNTDNSYIWTNLTSEGNYLEDEEKAIYNYLYATEGAEKAQVFLDNLADELNQRKGQAKADKVEGNFLGQMGVKAAAGFDQFGSGIAGLFNDGQAMTPSAIQYAGAAVDQDLANVDLKWYNFAEGQWKDQKIFGRSLGQLTGDAVQTTANMLPSIGASALVGIASPTAAPWVGSILMGSSAAGNAYQDMLNQGYSQGSAASYGILSGLSEMLLEKALGGITALGGGNLSKVATGKLAKLDGVLKKFAQSTGGQVLMNAGSEAMEEGLQSILEPYFKTIATGEDFTVDMEEALYSALMGFVTGGVFEGAPAATTAVGNKITSGIEAKKNAKAETPTDAPQQTAPGADTPQSNTPQPQSPQSSLDDLIDEAIARATNAPANPLNAAMDGYKSTGTVTNKQAQDILNNTRAITSLLEQTGIKLPDTASGRRAAVKEAVIQIAQQPQSILQTDVLSGSEIDTSAQNTPATEVPTAQPQTYTDELLDELIAANPNRQAIDTARKTVYDNKNTTGGTIYADAEQPGLSGTSEAGLPGGVGAEWIRGTNTQQISVSGQTPGGVEAGSHMGSGGLEAKPGSNGFEVQLRVSPVLRVSDNLATAQQQSGVKAYPVRDTASQPQTYADALTAGRNSDAINGWCVTPKSAQELQDEGVRTIMNDTGTVGAGIARNGDIVAVFKNKNGGPPRALDTLMPIAIEQGGDRLDCYGEGLVRTYENYGFVPVARVEFNPEYANDGWTPDKGTPYIYFMVHNGDTAVQVASNIRKYPHATQEQLDALPTYGKDDYDAAMSYRDDLMNRRAQSQNAEIPHAAESVGAAPGWFDPNTRLQYEHGTIPEGENPVRPDDLPKRDYAGGKVSHTARTVKGAKATPDEFIDLLNKEVTEGALSYVEITNSATTQKAIDHITQEGWDEARHQWSADVRAGKTGADMAAVGALLLNNAAKAGDRTAWLDILTDYQAMGTNTAQGLQALRILKTLEPSDKLYSIRRSVKRMVQDMHLDTDITIDPELETEYLNAETDQARNNVLKKIQKDVASQIPATWLEKWTSLRYVNMLGNFRTQVRNVAGNAGMKAVNAAKNAVATGLEAIASKVSGGEFQRTKSLAVSRDMLNTAKADFDTVRSAIMGNSKYGDSRAQSSEFAQGVQQERQIFKNKALEGYRKVTNWAMEQGDLIFSKSAYARALAGYLKANGISGSDLSSVDSSLMDNARLYAIKEAQEVTFRDSNILSDWISKVGRRKDTPGAVKAVSEGIMPFRKTPANVLVRAEEYSPLGIINSVVTSVKAMQKGSTVTGAQVINSWAKTLTGTGIFGLGMLLNGLGCLTSGADKDEDKDAFDSMNGWQNYALVLPDGTNLTIDFLTPAAMPLLMGAELMDLMRDGDLEAKDIESSLTSIVEPMVQMSMLQGVNDTLDNIQYAENNLGQLLINSGLSYLTQGLTNTLAGQLERTFEDSRMTTYVDKNSPLPAWLQRTLGKASAKIPIWDYNQIPYINAWGEEEENPEWIANGVYNLFSPSYIEKGASTALTEELNRLNEAQSDITVYPSAPDKTITYSKKEHNLSADEYVALAKSQGQTRKRIVEDIISSADYASLSDADKAKAISYAYDYARDTARIEVFDDYPGYSAKWMEQIDGNAAETILRQAVVGTTEKYTDLPISAAAYTDALLKSLQKESKEDGTSYSSIRDIQKMEAVVADHSLTTYTDALLRDIMPDSTEAKYDNALNKGFTAEQFVGGYRQYIDTTGEDKRLSVIRYCQREMGMSYAAAKKLYEIYSTKATEE